MDRISKTIKDLYGNDISLDENGNIILQPHYEAMFRDSETQTPYKDIVAVDVSEQTSLYATQVLEQTNQILEHSPFNTYKPIYLDPSLRIGQKSNYSDFKAWQNLYLQEPAKGAIAPWTKKEKAYYESLPTKRERAKYLIIRSGLRSAVIDIPLDAICGVDENGKLLNPAHEQLYAIVDRHKGLQHMQDGFLALNEWNISAGILGDLKAFKGLSDYTGFNARVEQVRFLTLQLGYGNLKYIDNTYRDPSIPLSDLAQNPPLDEFGMMPYIDEIIGVSWIIDFNRHNLGDGCEGAFIYFLNQQIQAGKLIDPRAKNANQQTREEFRKQVQEFMPLFKDNLSTFISQKNADDETKEWLKNLHILTAQVLAITPPQGYPNAPIYYTPEELEELYQAGKLDKLLNPTIPAIYRDTFPQELRDKIEAYAKEHNIQ